MIHGWYIMSGSDMSCQVTDRVAGDNIECVWYHGLKLNNCAKISGLLKKYWFVTTGNSGGDVVQYFVLLQLTLIYFYLLRV